MTYDYQCGKREIVLKYSTSKVCYRKFSALFCHYIFDIIQHNSTLPWVNSKKIFNKSIGFQSWVLLLGCCLRQERNTEYPRFLYSLNCFFLSDLHVFFLSSHILQGLFKLHLTINTAFSSDSSVNLIDRTFCRANLIQKLSLINCIRLIR